MIANDEEEKRTRIGPRKSSASLLPDSGNNLLLILQKELQVDFEHGLQ
jgi:hypothetical protein